MLIPIELPPGQYRNGTILQSMGRWRDASLVRWYDGIMRPVGGWSEFSDGTAAGIVRTAHAFSSVAGSRYVAVGSANALEVFNNDRNVVDITPVGLATGREASETATGYGSATYGRGRYSSEYADGTLDFTATVWSLESWGEDLIACNDTDGRIFLWQRDETQKAAVIAGAPVDCLSICVSDNRFLFAFGAGGDQRKVAWSDREDYTTWTPSATNEAGDFDLNSTGAIQAGLSFKGEVVILTDEDAHVARYVGPQLVHEFNQVGMSCGAVGRNAAAVTDAGVFWMGNGGFFVYSGGQVQRIPCDVSGYVFDDIGRFTGAHVSTVRIGKFSEIWWFYTTAAGTDNTRYVSFNYETGTWATGELARTAGTDQGIFPYPLILAGDTPFEHEAGTVPAGNPVFAESGPIALGSGETTFQARRVYTDEATQGGVTFTFKTKRHPNDTQSTHGPYTPANPMAVRFTGRQFTMRVDGDVGEDWRVGVQRVEGEPRGRR